MFEHTVKAPPKPGPLITECLAVPLAGLETLCKNLLRSRQLGYVSRTILPAFTCSHQQTQNLLHLRVTSKFCSMGRGTPLGIQNVPYILIYLAELKVKHHKTAHCVSSRAALPCDGVSFSIIHSMPLLVLCFLYVTAFSIT